MIAVLVYHKNIQTLYPRGWIETFKNSIKNQSYKHFTILECDYGATGYRLFENSIYLNEEKDNFVYAMMSLIDLAIKNNYQYIFNTNCDDYYSSLRIERQIRWLQKGFDVVGSNFSLVNDNNRVWHTHNFNGKIIKEELEKNHNIIAHPVVAFNAKFFNDFNYDPSEIPYEDLLLWKRSIGSKKFIILPEILLYHRVHREMVSRPESTNR